MKTVFFWGIKTILVQNVLKRRRENLNSEWGVVHICICECKCVCVPGTYHVVGTKFLLKDS